MLEDFPTQEMADALEPRALAAKVQMGQTADHDAAVAWSNFAIYRARRPEVRATDPTLAGEVYRNRALRLELTNAPVGDVDATVRASLTELVDPDSPKISRERAATLSVLARIVRHQILNGRSRSNIHQIRAHHRSAQIAFRSEHSFLELWDRYATMDDRHRGTSEITVPGGSTALAAVASLRGIWRAYRANPEGQPPKAHRDFVKKQLGANASVGFVAITKPVAAVPGIRRRRRAAINQLTD